MYLSTATLRSEFDSPLLADCLGEVRGIGPVTLEELEHAHSSTETCTEYTDSHTTSEHTLTVPEILRVRADRKVALTPLALETVSRTYADRVLNDCIDILEIPNPPGLLLPKLDIKSSIHGTDCGLCTVESRDFPLAFVDAMAELRSRSIVTNLGQSGCRTCGMSASRETAKNLEGTRDVVGYAGFSAQCSAHEPMLTYSSFYGPATTVGHEIISVLEIFDIPWWWDGTPDTTIQTYLDEL